MDFLERSITIRNMNETSTNNESEICCGLCGHNECEVKILSCGCSLHARCVPVTLLAQYRKAVEFKTHTTSQFSCPTCNSEVTGFYINPLSLTDLEKAGSLNHSDWINEMGAMNKKRKRGINGDPEYNMNIEASEESVHASASPFLLWSDSSSEKETQNEKFHFRTGRWSPSEIEYVDQLIQCFDQSTLALPHGIKLNELLRDLLMCKSSRLTKKMKNAKLSQRSYKLGHIPALHDFAEVSKAQQAFLDSVSSPVTRLVLKFNISRTWRIHFSNLCLQSGYDALENQDWLNSLDELDKRVTDAEESVRKYRRNRLIKALRNDTLQESLDGVYINGYPVPNKPVVNKAQRNRSNSVVALASLTTHLKHKPVTPASAPTQLMNTNNIKMEDAFGPSGDISITTINFNPTPMNEMNNDNFSVDFLDLDQSVSCETFLTLPETGTEKNNNLFLSRIMNFIKEETIPFHCVDCWIPCNNNEGGSQSYNDTGCNNHATRLIQAGHDCHSDASTLTAYHLHEFCVYSKNFSFSPGAGLPGRCYQSGCSYWESDIQNASQDHFRRLGGAKEAGLQTAVGIPIRCSKIGTVVVCMYSLLNVGYDEDLMRRCTVEFQKFNPEPKWSLSINIPESDKKPPTVPQFRPPLISSGPHSFQTSDCAQSHSSSKSQDASTGSNNDSINSDEAMEIANLLAEHMPSFEAEGQNRVELIRSLRMILLKCPHSVSAEEKGMLVILRKSYEGYCKVQRKKSDVVNLLVSDWEYLTKEHERKSPWGVSAMTHVNYASATSNEINACQVSPTIDELNSSNSSSIVKAGTFMLPPPNVSNYKIQRATGPLHTQYNFVSNVSLADVSESLERKQP